MTNKHLMTGAINTINNNQKTYKHEFHHNIVTLSGNKVSVSHEDFTVTLKIYIYCEKSLSNIEISTKFQFRSYNTEREENTATVNNFSCIYCRISTTVNKS